MVLGISWALYFMAVGLFMVSIRRYWGYLNFMVFGPLMVSIRLYLEFPQRYRIIAGCRMRCCMGFLKKIPQREGFGCTRLCWGRPLSPELKQPLHGEGVGCLGVVLRPYMSYRPNSSYNAWYPSKKHPGVLSYKS